ncbi:stomatin-like protein 3 isoform 2-T2 [Theristicus caerulescens]
MDPQRETPKKNNTEHLIADRREGIGVCGWILVSLSFLLVLITFPVSIWTCIKILTKDAVTTQVDGVVYYRIHSAVSAVANVTDVHSATFLLAQTTLRNILGTQSLAQLLAGREEIAHSIQAILDSATEQWGIKVARVEIKDVRIPVAMQRAMAAEAEAAREARAKIVAAEGEMNAAKALKQASMVLAESPAGLQLCYLQTLTTLAAENNSTIVFPLPINMLESFGQKNRGG